MWGLGGREKRADKGAQDFISVLNQHSVLNLLLFGPNYTLWQNRINLFSLLFDSLKDI